jgi:membrane fusion protein, multidrug efflux system
MAIGKMARIDSVSARPSSPEADFQSEREKAGEGGLRAETRSETGQAPAAPGPAGERPEPAPDAPGRREPTRQAPPTEPIGRGAERVPDHQPPSAPRRWLRLSLFALLPIALIIGGYLYVTGGQTMSTDDAYVNAEKVGVSTDVSGIVKTVEVTDNQTVTKGQVLYRLDPLQFQIALENAKANLAQVALTIDSLKEDYRRMLSDVAAQQAQVDFDQKNYERDAHLVGTGGVSTAAYQQAEYTLQGDKAKLESLRTQARVQLARLAGDADIPTTSHPQYRQAKAQVDEAQRELDHTIVTAPFPGIVTGVPTVAPGKYLAASTTAFYLVNSGGFWIDAQPKETEMTYVVPGQPATLTIDGYPNREWHGKVESIGPAAAQEFSLLPPQNTSGNWVKVVQRMPMRVSIDTSDPTLPPLRTGMSAEVYVHTGHARGLPHFLTAIF